MDEAIWEFKDKFNNKLIPDAKNLKKLYSK